MSVWTSEELIVIKRSQIFIYRWIINIPAMDYKYSRVKTQVSNVQSAYHVDRDKECSEGSSINRNVNTQTGTESCINCLLRNVI